MAKSNVYIIITILLTTMALFTSSSHGLSLGGLKIGAGEIYGLLKCNLTGDPNAPPISEATVILGCGDSERNLAQAVTDMDGTFIVVFKIFESILSDTSSCRVSVNLPVGNCTLPTPNGVLTSRLKMVTILVTDIINTAVLPPNHSPLCNG